MTKSQLREVRLDKWLWAARMYKTRPLAVKAITAGHVDVNGAHAKPARSVRVGDEVCVRKGPYTFDLVVAALSQQRGPAEQARLLYTEAETSVRERERLAGELRTRAAQVLYDRGKPSPREQRQARLRKREQS